MPSWLSDSIPLPSGGSFKFAPPVGQDLPTSGFTAGEISYYPQPTPEPQPATEVVIAKDSQRLEILEPFSSPFGENNGNKRGLELPACKVLMRVRGKCTTDHISAAVGTSQVVGMMRVLMGLNTGSVVEVQGPFDQHLREPT